MLTRIEFGFGHISYDGEKLPKIAVLESFNYRQFITICHLHPLSTNQYTKDTFEKISKIEQI